MHPRSEGLLESSLYVEDVAASAEFYKRIFGFPIVSDFGERGCALQAGTRQVLLLFKKGGWHVAHHGFEIDSRWPVGPLENVQKIEIAPACTLEILKELQDWNIRPATIYGDLGRICDSIRFRHGLP